MKEKDKIDRAPKFLDPQKWLDSVYGISRSIFQLGEGDWFIIDAADLTEEKLREFISGTHRISQIAGPVPRK